MIIRGRRRTFEGALQLFLRRQWVVLEERVHRHDDSWRAEAALRAERCSDALLEKTDFINSDFSKSNVDENLNRMKSSLAAADALHRRHRLTVNRRHWRQTGVN